MRMTYHIGGHYRRASVVSTFWYFWIRRKEVDVREQDKRQH